MNVLDPGRGYTSYSINLKIYSTIATSVTSVQSGLSCLHTQVFDFTLSPISNFIITMIDLLKREHHDISHVCSTVIQSHETNEQ